MNTAFLLILLTTNANAMPSVSFVNTESEAQCKARQTMITAIFRNGNITIDQSRCIASDLRFTKYSHNPSSNASRYFWLVDMTENAEQLTSMPDMSSCRSHLKKIENNKKSAICAVTDQARLY